MNPLLDFINSDGVYYIDRTRIISYPFPKETLIQTYQETGLQQLIDCNILYLIEHNKYNGVVLNSSLTRNEAKNIHEALVNGHRIGKRQEDEQLRLAKMIEMRYPLIEVHKFFNTEEYSKEIINGN